MATDTGLFGPTPWEVQQAQQQQVNTDASNFAQMDPFAKAGMMMYKGGAGIAGAVAPMLGGVNVAQQQAAQNQQALQGADLQTPEGLRAAAKKMLDVGNQKSAYLLAQKATEIERELAATALAGRKQDFQEGQSFDLKKMQVEAAIQAKQDAIQMQRNHWQSVADNGAASIEQRRQASEMLLSLKQQQLQVQQQGQALQKQLAEMADATKRYAIDNKVGASQSKSEEKAAKIEEGRASIDDTVTQAEQLVEKLAENGGMTSTRANPISNLGTSVTTSGVGQALGRMVGTENQSNRDVLKSTRLQLLNAIKQATGMGAGQLNSNVELQTWLSSLGAEGMTKEANLEILDKIRNKYMKGSPAAPTPPSTFDAKWAALPRGQSLVGPDGKTYTKK